MTQFLVVIAVVLVHDLLLLVAYVYVVTACINGNGKRLRTPTTAVTRQYT